MTVLHVVEALETGTARHVLDLVSRVDVRHVVAAPARRVGGRTDPRLVDRLRGAGADVRRVEMRRSPASPRNLAAVAAVRRIADDVGADVVHGHSSIGGVVARLAAGRRPCVYTPNGLAPGLVALAVERALRRRTARLVAVSPSERDEAVRRRLADAERIVVIPNGIDAAVPPRPSPSLRDLVGVPADQPLVGSIGRLVDQKAPLDLVDAWTRVAVAEPSARFVLVGDGPLAAEVDERAGALGDRFTRLPFLTDADAHLTDLDVFALASRFEGAPYVVLEALRGGVPVVATAVTGTKDLLAGGVGSLVAAGDVDALATAIIDALRSPPDPRPGRRRVAEGHDLAHAAALHRGLYDALASAGEGPPGGEHPDDPSGGDHR